MKVAIIGTGHVGLTTGACLAEVGHDVVCQDIDRRKLDALAGGDVPIFEPGLDELIAANARAGRLRFTGDLAEAVRHGTLLLICVGTPADERGKAYLVFVERVARQIARELGDVSDYRLLVDKSTVPVTTAARVKQTLDWYAPSGARYGVASNPEFLREGNAVKDTLRPDRIVVGVEPGDTESAALMRELYAPLLARHACPYLETEIRAAELIKHVANAALAMKLSFINFVARVCDGVGADVDEVARGVGLDPRIGPSFLRPGIGYGGSCFPKDVPAFRAIASDLGLDAGLLAEVERINATQLDYFMDKLDDELWILSDKTFAVWGLAFKADTDDLRESPAVKLVGRLAARGAHVRAFDPRALDNARREFQGVAGITLCDSADACLTGATCLIVATEWPEFTQTDPLAVCGQLELPLVFDAKNCLDAARWVQAGFTYHGIGRRQAPPTT